MSCFSYPVSIQLLLLFYYSINNKYGFPFAFQYNSCYCSMIERISINEEIEVFQYNSCYCSILPSIAFFGNSNGFNTTLVTVLLKQYMSRLMVQNVSIQLLLLFYEAFERCSGEEYVSFNTTLVTVLFFFWLCRHRFFICFNTTLVTVLFFCFWSKSFTLSFQYNSCYCSIYNDLYKTTHNYLVSIQLLLLFYLRNYSRPRRRWRVSIQLLLLFYSRSRWSHWNITVVSIQLLLLFYETAQG